MNLPGGLKAEEMGKERPAVVNVVCYVKHAEVTLKSPNWRWGTLPELETFSYSCPVV